VHIRVCANPSNNSCPDSPASLFEYQLGYQFVIEEWPGLEWILNTINHETTRLTSITKYGWNAQGQKVALPSTTFTYGSYNQANDTTDPADGGYFGGKLKYPRLLTVNNGYGGQVTFTYDPPIGLNGVYSYRVKHKDTSDGLGHTARTTYTYTDPCFSRLASGSNCRRSALEDATYALIGHGTTTVAVYNYDSALLNKTTHTFITAATVNRGKTSRTQVYNPSNQLLQQQETTWGITSFGPPAYAVDVGYVAQTLATDYTGSPAATTRTTYSYDMYGNVKAENQHGDMAVSGDERMVWYWYYNIDTAISDGKWFIGLKWAENVYQSLTASESTLKTQTLWYYDDLSYNIDNFSAAVPPAVTITQGALTMVGRGKWSESATPGRFVLTKYAYDNWGNVTSEIDPNNNTTTTNYETTYRQFPTWVRRHTGTQYLYSYTRYYGNANYPINEEVRSDDYGLFGQVQKTYDSNGESATRTYYVYDAFGRLVKEVRPGDSFTYPTVKYLYTDAYVGGGLQGFKLITAYRENSGSGACLPIVAFYDGLGRLVQQRSEYQEATTQSVVNWLYDAAGRVLSEFVPEVESMTWNFSRPSGWDTRPRTQTGYNARGQVNQTTAPDGTVSYVRYYGRQTATLDALGHLKISVLDAYGQLVEVREYAGTYTTSLNWTTLASSYYARTRYTYDTLGNLTTVTDALNNVTTMVYDNLSRKTDMYDRDMGHWVYTYDDAGNLKTQTDARGCVTTFTYDKLNRLTRKTYSGACSGTAVVYTYDAYSSGTNYGRGYRTSMTDGSGSTTWTYDTRGRVTKETKVINGGGTFVTQWGYDAMDRVKWMKYPSGNTGGTGEQVNYTYAANGALNSAIGTSTYVQSTTYDAAGRVDLRVLGANTLKQDYIYYPWTTANGQGRLQYLKTGTPSYLTSLQYMRYTYDAVGNVTNIYDYKAGGTQTQHFTYRCNGLSSLKRCAILSPIGNQACGA